MSLVSGGPAQPPSRLLSQLPSLHFTCVCHVMSSCPPSCTRGRTAHVQARGSRCSRIWDRGTKSGREVLPGVFPAWAFHSHPQPPRPCPHYPLPRWARIAFPSDGEGWPQVGCQACMAWSPEAFVVWHVGLGGNSGGHLRSYLGRAVQQPLRPRPCGSGSLGVFCP